MATPGPSNPPTTNVGSLETPLPSVQVLVQAAKLAQQLDRPILLDYYADSCSGRATVAEDQDTKDKLLMKGTDEYTSLIQKLYRVAEDFLVLTENSIYIVSGKIQKRKFQVGALVSSMN